MKVADEIVVEGKRLGFTFDPNEEWSQFPDGGYFFRFTTTEDAARFLKLVDEDDENESWEDGDLSVDVPAVKLADLLQLFKAAVREWRANSRLSRRDMQAVINQPIKYHGGKGYLGSWIHSLAPPSVIDDPSNGYTHRHIGFAGGLGEFWNWNPVDGIAETINDANRALSNFYAVLRDNEAFEIFKQLCESSPLECELFQQCRDATAHSSAPCDPHSAWAFFVKYRQSRQGLGKDYCTPTRRTRRGMNEQVSAWLSAVDGLPDAHARLRRVEIMNMDALKFIDRLDHERALFYLDPPYMHETRSSKGEYGQHEMSEVQHFHLLKQLNCMKGKFLLSGYHSPMYDAQAKRFGWKCFEKLIDNKASSAKVKEIKTECVWVNY